MEDVPSLTNIKIALVDWARGICPSSLANKIFGLSCSIPSPFISTHFLVTSKLFERDGLACTFRKLRVADLLLKHIDFRGSKTLWFRQPQKRPDKSRKAGPGAHEAPLSSSFPNAWVESMRVQKIGDNAVRVVC